MAALQPVPLKKRKREAVDAGSFVALVAVDCVDVEMVVGMATGSDTTAESGVFVGSWVSELTAQVERRGNEDPVIKTLHIVFNTGFVEDKMTSVSFFFEEDQIDKSVRANLMNIDGLPPVVTIPTAGRDGAAVGFLYSHEMALGKMTFIIRRGSNKRTRALSSAGGSTALAL